MQLHITLDIPDLEHTLFMVSHIHPYVDAIHVSPLFLYTYGISVIDTIKVACPEKPILVHTNIIDDGKKIVSLFDMYKPHWLTVLAGAESHMIHATTSAAHTMRIKIMMNLVDAASIGQSAMEAEGLGADALIFQQLYNAEDPLLFMDKWELVKENTKLPIFIATTITKQNVKDILALKPSGVIIGSAAFDTKKPEVDAQFFYELCNKN